MKRKSRTAIIRGLLKLLSPLLPVMLCCITFGVLGYLCAIFITILTAHLLLTATGVSPWTLGFETTAVIMIVLALGRAVLRYSEQTCGHYIAFKLLAVIRDKVFGALRYLAPAKLEGRERGDLIAVISGDIELLEVFYAHTIAPVCIAVVASCAMTFVIGAFNVIAGVLAALSYIAVGVLVPVIISGRRDDTGMESRKRLGDLNSVFLENLRGVHEILQFGQGQKKETLIREKTVELNGILADIKRQEGIASSWSGAIVMTLPLCMLGADIALNIGFPATVMTTVMLAASFGPVLALANLSSTMKSMLASGERVLTLLEETPETPDVLNGKTPEFIDAELRHLCFAYGKEEILHKMNAKFKKGEITVVSGKSGSGKSTMLKLLMRFWRVPGDMIRISGTDVDLIETAHLRKMESYMTQSTDLFNISVQDNIRIGKPDANDKEVEVAAKKAGIHDFILTLPQGYDTKIGELGGRLSDGERQRIGLARAFLHDASLLLLDEPTSNLDNLNEAMILRSIREEADRSGRTVVLVSHRKSAFSIADKTCIVENGRMS